MAGESSNGDDRNVVAVHTTAEWVKTIKSWLECHDLSGKRIERLNTTSTPTFVLPTTLPTLPHPPPELASLPGEYTLHSIRARALPAPPSSPLHTFLKTYLTSHPPTPASSITSLLSSSPKRSTIYPPLLLLAHDAFTTPPWTSYLESHPSFLPSLAAHLKLTHIARNAPIAASSTTRLPSSLCFLHPVPLPSQDDLETALWVSTTQHGLFQTWAPAHTMFSRGNIREKARVLGFAGVGGGEVADLYAGIGYFVFPYVAAGAERVWCWELNPWSVEALRRGCVGNGWTVAVVQHGEEFVDRGERVVVFSESNEFAVNRMRGRKRVRHINLGLLPSSRGAWDSALELVEEGGCVHVHENVGEEETGVKMKEFVEVFRNLEGERGGRRVVCEHVERVKTFAPGVVHCVFDMRIGSGGEQEGKINVDEVVDVEQ